MSNYLSAFCYATLAMKYHVNVNEIPNGDIEDIFAIPVVNLFDRRIF